MQAAGAYCGSLPHGLLIMSCVYSMHSYGFCLQFTIWHLTTWLVLSTSLGLTSQLDQGHAESVWSTSHNSLRYLLDLIALATLMVDQRALAALIPQVR